MVVEPLSGVEEGKIQLRILRPVLVTQRRDLTVPDVDLQNDPMDTHLRDVDRVLVEALVVALLRTHHRHLHGVGDGCRVLLLSQFLH